MDEEEMIRIDLICTGYNVEPSFLEALEDSGLIEIVAIENSRFVESRWINDLEKMIRMHYEMDINFEGIETIMHLLGRVNDLQHEVNMLRNKLRFFEID